MPRIFDLTTRVLTQALKGTQRRHEVISNNIANADTPNFRASDYRFEEAIRQVLDEERPNPSSSASAPLRFYHPLQQLQQMMPRVQLTADEELDLVPADYQQTRLDSNTTDIDREMGKLAQNTIEHHAYVQLINAKFRMLRTAMKG